MKKILKFIFIFVGFISLILGVIGIIIPVLPTTPFLLITSFCFVKGSERFNIWFKSTKIYKKHLEEFVNNRVMTLKQKVRLIVLVDIMLAFPFVLINSVHLRIFIVVLIAIKIVYFTFGIKTIKENKEIEEILFLEKESKIIVNKDSSSEGLEGYGEIFTCENREIDKGEIN